MEDNHIGYWRIADVKDQGAARMMRLCFEIWSERPCFGTRFDDGSSSSLLISTGYHWRTYAEVGHELDNLTAGMRSLGMLSKHDMWAISSENREVQE